MRESSRTMANASESSRVVVGVNALRTCGRLMVIFAMPSASSRSISRKVLMIVHSLVVYDELIIFFIYTDIRIGVGENLQKYGACTLVVHQMADTFCE